jgi:hypothetical protein
MVTSNAKQQDEHSKNRPLGTPDAIQQQVKGDPLVKGFNPAVDSPCHYFSSLNSTSSRVSRQTNPFPKELFSGTRTLARRKMSEHKHWYSR